MYYEMVDEAKLTELEGKLKDNAFIKGQAPGAEDADTLALFKANKFVPDQAKHPNVWAWYALVVLFEDEVVASWKVAEEKKGKKEKGGKKEEKKEEKAADDDFDPFAEETEEDKQKLKELKEKKGEKKGDKKKKKEVQKSLVLLEVKGWESDQDLDALALKIQTLKMEGLQWKSEYKLQEVAFGVKKIIIGMIVEDEIVSVDDVIDKLQAWEDEVQSVDILSFNKL